MAVRAETAGGVTQVMIFRVPLSALPPLVLPPLLPLELQPASAVAPIVVMAAIPTSARRRLDRPRGLLSWMSVTFLRAGVPRQTAAGLPERRPCVNEGWR